MVIDMASPGLCGYHVIRACKPTKKKYAYRRPSGMSARRSITGHAILIAGTAMSSDKYIVAIIYDIILKRSANSMGLLSSSSRYGR